MSCSNNIQPYLTCHQVNEPEKPTREERLKTYEYAREYLNENMDSRRGICSLLNLSPDPSKLTIKDFPELVETKPHNKGYLDYWFSSAKERIQVLTKIINKMKDNRIPIELPSDCEAKFDEENNVLIISKKNQEVYIPDSVEELPERTFQVDRMKFSSLERAFAFTHLADLVEMRDASNGDWRADWADAGITKYTITNEANDLRIAHNWENSRVLHFKSKEIARAFLNKHRELILTAKELL